MRRAEGIRRLAFAVGIVGALLSGYYRAWPQYKIIREHGWHHAYFETQRRDHPKATEETDRWGWNIVLADPEDDNTVVWPPRYGNREWHVDPSGRWHTGPAPYRQSFPKDWRIKLDWGDYATLLIPVALGFLIPWGIVRAAAWVIHGFQIDRSPTP